jgi:NAD(P)H-nitrite reductase large subunit
MTFDTFAPQVTLGRKNSSSASHRQLWRQRGFLKGDVIMAENQYTYVIVGAGLAGGSAAQAIREIDSEQSLLLIGAEKHLPYHRPPLSKGLWTQTKTIPSIFLEDDRYYENNRIDTHRGDPVVELNAEEKWVVTKDGVRFGFEKLLLATGGAPKKLPIPGGDHPDIIYFRTLDDFTRAREIAAPGKKALVIGGGFIGSEIAAALSRNKLDVTMLFLGHVMCERVFPSSLGAAIQRMYEERGVHIRAGDAPVSIEKRTERFVITTRRGESIEADMIIAGVGIAPDTGLAAQAKLRTGNGIVVDDYFQTSDPVIHAAGDNALFPYKSLGARRIEHWDAAASQGAHAGRVMAGQMEPYTYLPYYFSDLFDFGYEAVGETDPGLETFADWKTENETGVVYYLKESRVRGVLLCNVWGQVDRARELVENQKPVSPDDLAGLLTGD